MQYNGLIKEHGLSCLVDAPVSSTMRHLHKLTVCEPRRRMGMAECADKTTHILSYISLYWLHRCTILHLQKMTLFYIYKKVTLFSTFTNNVTLFSTFTKTSHYSPFTKTMHYSTFRNTWHYSTFAKSDTILHLEIRDTILHLQKVTLFYIYKKWHYSTLTKTRHYSTLTKNWHYSTFTNSDTIINLQKRVTFLHYANMLRIFTLLYKIIKRFITLVYINNL